MRGMITVMLAHVGIVRHGMRMDLAVLYDVCECSAACSMGGAGTIVGVEAKKYRFFFLTAIGRSMAFLSGLPKGK